MPRQRGCAEVSSSDHAPRLSSLVSRVKLLRAANLVDKDGLGSGVSDPYVLMTVGAHTHKVPTKR